MNLINCGENKKWIWLRVYSFLSFFLSLFLSFFLACLLSFFLFSFLLLILLISLPFTLSEKFSSCLALPKASPKFTKKCLKKGLVFPLSLIFFSHFFNAFRGRDGSGIVGHCHSTGSRLLSGKDASRCTSFQSSRTGPSKAGEPSTTRIETR